MALLFYLLRKLFAVTAVAFILSGLDDLFLDLYYYVKFSFRLMRRWPKMTRADLELVPEQHIAMIVPAWQEHAVIGQMLTRTLRTSQYKNFAIFVGTYPNDPATQAAVDAIAQKDARVHKVVLDHDGPTTKSDCLNGIMAAIAAFEAAGGPRSEVILLQDSEDVVDPLALKFMNYLVPRFYLVQLPVVPLPVPWYQFTAGTYLDEFAEYHTKDIWVRERLTKMVPSAGVGTGFSREALDRQALYGPVFNILSLTEDYEISFRLGLPGKRSILLRYMRPEQRGQSRSSRLIATREYFPSSFRAAVRQKARWTIGIVFQGWRHIGWRSGAGMRYMLWRDRKAMLTYIFNLLGYLMFAVVVALYLLSLHHPQVRGDLQMLLPPGGKLRIALAINILFIFWRLLQRAIAVCRVGGCEQIFLSIVRTPWAHVINFFALLRAFRLVAQSLLTGNNIRWDKTQHHYPETQEDSPT